MNHTQNHLGLRHVALKVASAVRSAAFYQTYFGMAVEWSPDKKNVYMSHASQDNLAIHEEANWQVDPGKQGLDHFGFIMKAEADVDALYERVAADGVVIVAAPKRHRDGSYSFYLRDPDGYVVQAIFHPPIVAQGGGASAVTSRPSPLSLPDFADLEAINNGAMQNTLGATLGMRVVKLDNGHVEATMPVEPRTHQPYGLLHGGASVALAETVASLGGWQLVASQGKIVVGQEINANHIRGVRAGLVRAVGEVLHAGKTSQVWEIKIYDEKNRLVCVSRCTLAVIEA